ncbi:MAG: cation:proton antiporter [Acetobacteraceae bacterium]
MAYLIGSIALATILFEGGLKTERAMLRSAFWPATAMATVGVAVTSGVIAVAAVGLLGASWISALAIGAALAPTDAAAVNLLLTRAQVQLPERLLALLEVESGLNDPMSVFLMVALVQVMVAPGGAPPGRDHAAARRGDGGRRRAGPGRRIRPARAAEAPLGRGAALPRPGVLLRHDAVRRCPEAGGERPPPGAGRHPDRRRHRHPGQPLVHRDAARPLRHAGTTPLALRQGR